MKRTIIAPHVAVECALFLFFAFVPSTWAQIDLGNFTLSGSAEVDGLPRSFSGDKTRFQLYRDIPESLVVPQLELFLGSKKEDFFFKFDATHVGRSDQNYGLRFGRYGLFSVELEWDQIPHALNIDNARTPYRMNGGVYTLPTRPTAADIADNTTTPANLFNAWINANARSVDLDLLNKLGKVSVRYTPNPGWSFTGNYWSQKTDGNRALAFPFGSGSSSNVAELAEPIDYQTHNIELGAEYAAKNWSLGLKYNGSIFRNNISTLIFDNPAAAGPGCVDAAVIDYSIGAGPCRGRADLYPSNQAHTFTMISTASLPLRTKFLGTVSYGWRFQDDSFLPFTINSAIARPALSRNSLEGDIRPTTVNLTLVNNFVDRLNLKAYYRLYDLDNQTSAVSNNGTVLNDQGGVGADWIRAVPYQYSRNSAGFQAGYSFARWLTGKFDLNWNRTHRDIPQVPGNIESLTANEIKIGPTVDVKPFDWWLLRGSYHYAWRTDPGYNATREMFFLTERNRSKLSLFSELSRWETLSFNFGFDYIRDSFPEDRFGVESAQNYSPSVGFTYTPVEWLKFFADYNFDVYRWRQQYDAEISSRGRDKINTLSIGSDVEIIKNLLGFRIQYGFSQATSKINNKDITNPGVDDPNWPANSNTWHELLARFEYQFHKNLAFQVGYYFNKFQSKDFGVDIMKLWMGDLDTNSGQLRSIYLGDRFKGDYTAHVAVLGLKLRF